MSLDSLIERAVKALEKQADSMERLAVIAEKTASPAATPAEPAENAETPAADPKSSAKGKAKPTKTTAAEKASAAEVKEEVKAEAKGDAAPAENFLDEKKASFTSEDVRKELQKYVAKNNADGQGTTRAKALLKKLAGVNLLKELKEEQYKAVIDGVQAALNPATTDGEEL